MFFILLKKSTIFLIVILIAGGIWIELEKRPINISNQALTELVINYLTKKNSSEIAPYIRNNLKIEKLAESSIGNGKIIYARAHLDVVTNNLYLISNRITPSIQEVIICRSHQNSATPLIATAQKVFFKNQAYLIIYGDVCPEFMNPDQTESSRISLKPTKLEVTTSDGKKKIINLQNTNKFIVTIQGDTKVTELDLFDDKDNFIGNTKNGYRIDFEQY